MQTDKQKLIYGEAIEQLQSMKTASVQAVIADPPYLIGAISAGDKKSKAGTYTDLMNNAVWFAAWFREAWRVVDDTGFLVSFTNWRSGPVLHKAAADAHIPVSNKVIWDKMWIGPSAPNQLRSSYEEIFIMAKPKAKILDRRVRDVVQCKWMAAHNRVTEHPAEKPVELMRQLVTLTTAKGDLVVDPFCGSGTTGVACLHEGRRFIGIENDADRFEMARKRFAGLN